MGINIQSTGKISKLSISRLLFLISCAVPFLGIVVSPTIVWPMTFGLAIAWILLGRYEMNGALATMWGVRVEPAPCDTLFIYAWFKHLASGKLAWPSLVGLHMLLFFVLLNVLQLFLVQNLERGLWFAGATAYTVSLGILFASGIGTMSEFKTLQRYYLAAVIVTAGTLLLLAGLYLVGLATHLPQLYHDRRPMGFFKDPNVAGPFVVTGTLFAFSQLLFLRKGIASKTGILFFLSLLAVIATFSRGALLNLVIGILAIGTVAFWFRKGWRFVLATILSVVVIAPIFIYLLTFFGQAFRVYGFTEYDVYGRFLAWKAGLLIIRDYPWGIGPGQFEIFSPEYQIMLEGPVIVTPSAHNMYLRVLAENNALGLIVLLFAFGALISGLVRSLRIAARKDKGLLADGAWLFGAIMGILAESTVIDTLHWRHFFILLGFALAYYVLIRKEAGRG